MTDRPDDLKPLAVMFEPWPRCTHTGPGDHDPSEHETSVRTIGLGLDATMIIDPIVTDAGVHGFRLTMSMIDYGEALAVFQKITAALEGMSERHPEYFTKEDQS